VYRQIPGNQAAHETAYLQGIRKAVEAGCRLIQIRERDLEARALARLSREIIESVSPMQARVLVNDRLDVALMSEADGVHLRASSIPAREARRTALRYGRESFIIGSSTHSLEESVAASDGSDFIVCGPVFETASKPGATPLGLARLTEIVRACPIPVLGIGGITLENFRDVLNCGAAGIAGIGLFSDEANIRSNVRTILSA
jgi:thiamine-phosphate diphosphorylase